MSLNLVLSAYMLHLRFDSKGITWKMTLKISYLYRWIYKKSC